MTNKQPSTDHPYRHQPEKAFWRKVVQDTYPLDITHWYSKKFTLDKQRIATAGSCFAQHIGRELREKGFNYVDVEPAPGFLNKAHWLDFGYGMYSARYGNVYTPRQLLQLTQRALGEFSPVESAWNHGVGFVDPFRPTIEPEPFSSIDEVELHRKHHLASVAGLFEVTDVFVFTLGLTEAWLSSQDGAVYPVCPGTAGGEFDAGKYKFINFSFPEVRKDMEDFIVRVRQINPRMRFLLTVSPVPLMATATGQQVVVATTYSKSVLRAVAGLLADKYPYVDYFPSYEIISAPVMRGQFYNPDMRTVARVGVDHVMKQFFKEHAPPFKKQANLNAVEEKNEDDVICDEELLAVFGEK